MATEEIILKVADNGSNTGSSISSQKDSKNLSASAASLLSLKKGIIGAGAITALIKSSTLMSANYELAKKSFFLGLRPIGNMIGKGLLPYSVSLYREMALMNRSFDALWDNYEKSQRKNKEEANKTIAEVVAEIEKTNELVPKVVDSIEDVAELSKIADKNSNARAKIAETLVKRELDASIEAYKTFNESTFIGKYLVAGIDRLLNAGVSSMGMPNWNELVDEFKTAFQKTSKETTMMDSGFAFQKQSIDMEAANQDIHKQIMDTWNAPASDDVQIQMKIETLKKFNELIGGLYGGDAVITYKAATDKEYQNMVKRIYDSDLSNAEKKATLNSYNTAMKEVYNEDMQKTLKKITGDDYAVFFDEVTGQPKEALQKYFGGETTLSYAAKQLKSLVTDAVESARAQISKIRSQNYKRSFSSFFSGDSDSDYGPQSKVPTSVNDFILTKSGELIKTNPNDTITGTKSNNANNMSNTIKEMNVNINVQELNSDSQIRDVAQKVSAYIQREVSYRVGG